MPKHPDPRSLQAPPSARSADTTHPIAALPERPERSEHPKPPERPERRTSRGGEVLKRYSLWLTEADSAIIDRLTREVPPPEGSRSLDRSTIVRLAIRLAARVTPEELSAEEEPLR